MKMPMIWLIAALLFIMSPGAAFAEPLKCGICNKDIEGRYYKIKKRGGEVPVCMGCYEKTPRCPLCQGFMDDGVEIDGRKLCPECFDKVKESPVCMVCARRIVGSYMVYSDKTSGAQSYVCQQCNDNSERCGICNIPSTSLQDFEGKKICVQCAKRVESSPVCRICKKHIVGPYSQYKDDSGEEAIYVCEKCAEYNQKCYVCNVPSSEPVRVQGKDVCPQCMGKLKKCYGCGRYIFKLSYNYEIAEQTYCPDCENKTPKCDVCGLPAGPAPVVLSDGRRICPDCEGTAVKEIDVVKELYESVAAFLIREYSMNIGHINKINFKERSELKVLGGEAPTAEKDVVPLGIFARRNENFDIFVQKNLPKNLLIGVLAHEYAHAYMHEMNQDFKDVEIEEGFAEWVRYKTLEHIGDSKGAKLIERRDDIYGKGFKRVRQVENSEGLTGVFRLFIKAGKSLKDDGK